MNRYKIFIKTLFGFCILFNIPSCQKELKLKYNESTIKQVIIANFTPNSYLQVNISKSKQHDDFNAVEFLNDCKVDLYEDEIFKETMSYVLKDTLSGLGFYTSSFKLLQNRKYKIISTHTTLGIATAEEVLPAYPRNVEVLLLQHADTSHLNVIGKYMLTFQDTANAKNYYIIMAYYKAIRTVIDSLGDTTYKTDYLYNVPSYTPEIPNLINYGRSYFTDANFDGQLKTYIFSFSSQYDNSFTQIYNAYKEIYFIVEFSSVGEGYYNWYIQQLPKGDNIFNDGQNERINLSTNIINGYGHFSAVSSKIHATQIK